MGRLALYSDVSGVHWIDFSEEELPSEEFNRNSKHTVRLPDALKAKRKPVQPTEDICLPPDLLALEVAPFTVYRTPQR